MVSGPPTVQCPGGYACVIAPPGLSGRPVPPVLLSTLLQLHALEFGNEEYGGQHGQDIDGRKQRNGDVDQHRTALRRKYVDQFAEVLPGRKVARFYQIENKVDAVIRYDLAATIPVVETGSPPAAK